MSQPAEPPVLPPRPAPPRRLTDVAGAWLAWIGVGRLLLVAVSVTVVVGGAAWLLRGADPSPEAALPVAVPGPPTATLAPPASVPDAPVAVLVHVAGAVLAPGVYELPAGDRVDDAIRAAGGPRPDADLDGLNLAAPLADGQRIYVPEVGEIDPATVPSGGPPDGVADGSEPAGPVDLNRATAAELEALPGVGPATAAAIVDDRTRKGPFASVDDLDRVAGIGPAKLAALRELVTV